MGNSHRIQLAAAIMVVLCMGLWVGDTAYCATPEKIDLKILYAGNPDSERAKKFITFLGSHFTGVKEGDLATFTPENAVGMDVVILDYDGDGFKSPRPQISQEYDRPTVLMGVTGALMGSNARLKTGYL